MAITLGTTVTDKLTDLKGIAVSRTTFLHGCVRIGIQPTKLVDGKQAEKLWLDEQQLVEDNPSTTKLHPCLGQTLTDSISGYKGIAVARTEYLYSCPRIALQSKGLKDGKPIEQIDIDEPQLKGYKPEPKATRRTGGPGDMAPRQSSALQSKMATR